KFFINTGYSHRINSNEIQEYFKYAEEDEIHVYGIISLWFEELNRKFLKQYDSINSIRYLEKIIDKKNIYEKLFNKNIDNKYKDLLLNKYKIIDFEKKWCLNKK
ncbi:hypothetical protein KA977_11185, partial [Candidatus Dependentiae bacterium]|nr:hypothetical protein [Candidatus Dependentiae bacterium]